MSKQNIPPSDTGRLISDPEFCGIAASGKIADLKEWLQKGVSPNAIDQIGQTALSYAISARRFDSVKVLVEAGADINKKSPVFQDGTYPLDMVRILISANSVDEPLVLQQIEKYLVSKSAKGVWTMKVKPLAK